MNFKKYHESRNLLSEKYENRSINGSGAFVIDNNFDLWIGEVVAGQTYTISNMDAVYGFFTTKPMSNTGVTYNGSRGYESSGTAVVTVPSGCTWIAVRVLHNADNAMLNTGSTPLPYEPYSSEVWHDTPHYIHNTSTDTVTTLPAVVYPNAATATVGLKGQATQSGTPSPDNPIQPQECGDLSENLYDVSNPNIFNGYYNVTTNTLLTTENNAFIYIPLVQGKKYYVYGCKRYNASTLIRWTTTSSAPFYNISCVRTGQFAQTDIFTITAEANENYLAIFLCGDSDYSAYGTVEDAIATNGVNLVIDNGYKIPILNNSQTTNVYLGEVQTTRRIKKLVLTGQEDWTLHSLYANLFTLNTITDYLFTISNIIICNAYKSVSNTGAADIGDKQIGFYFNTGISARVLYIKDTTYSTAADFKSYLAQQYANGTPVTVWYVLAEPTTGIVNEPLMRIGNYADTLSNVSIPVTAGGDTLSVGTTVQPSEVTVNYKGWHPVQNVHEFTGNYTVGTMQTLPISELETHTISELQGGEWS